MRVPFDNSIFLCKITAVSGSDISFDEWWWSDATAAAAKKVGGRYASPANPGRAVSGATFSVGDFALAQSADGAGGLKWHVFPLGGGPSLVTGSADLAADVALNATAFSTLTSLGINLSLPSAGTYRLTGHVTVQGSITGFVQGGNGYGVDAYLFDNNPSVSNYLPYSGVNVVNFWATTSSLRATGHFSTDYVTTVATTIDIVTFAWGTLSPYPHTATLSAKRGNTPGTLGTELHHEKIA